MPPINFKQIRGDQAPLMNKSLIKTIMQNFKKFEANI